MICDNRMKQRENKPIMLVSAKKYITVGKIKTKSIKLTVIAILIHFELYSFFMKAITVANNINTAVPAKIIVLPILCVIKFFTAINIE